MEQSVDDVVLGKVTSPYGIKGWLKVFSYTDPIDNILDYKEWLLKQGGRVQPTKVVQSKKHGKGLIVQLEGCNDRNQAERYCGAQVLVKAGQLPALEEGDFYWRDLQGLSVRTQSGVILGRVAHLMETGSNDVLVVKATAESIDDQERLIPYLVDRVVLNVDLSSKVIDVDWDPEF